ncbi:MAG TPA: F0F1 ATP synthase subunit delta [Acidimicrobiales bacterium]|nr:F0F1 ATP synthase subunit delta [Acidimicrobiales bacterium]
MTFNVWTFLFEVLNFLVLAFVLHRILYRPLREAIDKRKAENERARTEAEAARKEADAAREQLAAKSAGADRERQQLLRKAAEEAEAEKNRRLQEAEAAARVVSERARHEAEQLRRETLAGLEGEVGALAVALAERLLTQACDRSLNGQLARHLGETVRAVTGEERDRVRRDAGTGGAVVESSAALDDATRKDLTAAAQDLLGRPGEVKFEVKPALVGGALLRAGGHVWDATVAAQMEAANAAVGGGGDGRPG